MKNFSSINKKYDLRDSTIEDKFTLHVKKMSLIDKKHIDIEKDLNRLRIVKNQTRNKLFK